MQQASSLIVCLKYCHGGNVDSSEMYKRLSHYAYLQEMVAQGRLLVHNNQALELARERREGVAI